MHELAITESVVSAVSERIREGRVTSVVLEIGRLSGVVPDALRLCFDVCAAGTVADGAALEILEVPGRARCLVCERELEVEDFFAVCSCGSPDLEYVGGRDLRLVEVEVV